MHDPTLQPAVKSYPERLFGFIPLPLWLSVLLFWEIIFLIDYLLTLSLPGGHEHILVFGLITLFFASLCIGTMYCSWVFHGLYSHLSLFIDELKEKLYPFYHIQLKKCYQGPWQIVAGGMEVNYPGIVGPTVDSIGFVRGFGHNFTVRSLYPCSIGDLGSGELPVARLGPTSRTTRT